MTRTTRPVPAMSGDGVGVGAERARRSVAEAAAAW
jgi:hypothetical protein